MMPDKYEKEILKSLTTRQIVPAGKHYPLYYQVNDDLIRENADGTKYKIILDNNNQEKIIKKL